MNDRATGPEGQGRPRRRPGAAQMEPTHTISEGESETTARPRAGPGVPWRSILVVALFGIAVFGGVWFADWRSGQDEAANANFRPVSVAGVGGVPQVGAPAPDFRSQDLDGNPVALSDERGKAVMV